MCKFDRQCNTRPIKLPTIVIRNCNNHPLRGKPPSRMSMKQFDAFVSANILGCTICMLCSQEACHAEINNGPRWGIRMPLVECSRDSCRCYAKRVQGRWAELLTCKITTDQIAHEQQCYNRGSAMPYPKVALGLQMHSFNFNPMDLHTDGRGQEIAHFWHHWFSFSLIFPLCNGRFSCLCILSSSQVRTTVSMSVFQ